MIHPSLPFFLYLHLLQSVVVAVDYKATLHLGSVQFLTHKDDYFKGFVQIKPTNNVVLLQLHCSCYWLVRENLHLQPFKTFFKLWTVGLAVPPCTLSLYAKLG